MAFVRCLTPDVVAALAVDKQFAPSGWHVWRVADLEDPEQRTVSADQAVELRESKKHATLLLVDTIKAGAGMDGIYSAAREVDEAALFKEAYRLAAKEVTRCLGRATREFAEHAIKKARGTASCIAFPRGPNLTFSYKLPPAAGIPANLFTCSAYGPLSMTMLRIRLRDLNFLAFSSIDCWARFLPARRQHNALTPCDCWTRRTSNKRIWSVSCVRQPLGRSLHRWPTLLTSPISGFTSYESRVPPRRYRPLRSSIGARGRGRSPSGLD